MLLRDDPFDGGRPPRMIATGYGGSVRASFSGTAAYLAEAGIADGSLDGAFTLYSSSRPDRVLQARGALWKARRLFQHQASSGFKFAGEFSTHLWHRHLPSIAGTDVVSTFQLYSDEFFERRSELGIRGFFYLDGTFHDYLHGYRDYDVAAIDPATAAEAIEIERRGYQTADGIAVMSAFAANTLTSRYGVLPDRITVVPPGANMNDETAALVLRERDQRPESDDFTVGFVGLYPDRKGLPKLADAIAELRSAGVRVRLCVVGNCPAHIAARDGVDALGPIDKSAAPNRFARALARIDLGCQLSTVELYGIAVLEFLRCGIPFLATEVGGITDILSAGGGIGVPADVSAEAVAAVIRSVVEDEQKRARLADEAQARMDGVRWQRSAAALGALVGASPQ